MPKSKPHLELDRLLELAKYYAGPKSLAEFFVYGQLMDYAPHRTREEIEKSAEEMYGPWPER